jgi:type I restriction enzyme S subunit
MKEIQTVPVKNFVLGIYDGPHATPYEVDEGPVFLGIKNVTPEGRLDLSEIRHVSEQEYLKWTKRVTPQKNDVVFSYEATLHRYALIPEGFHGCLGRRMALIRPDLRKIIPRFLHYYFMSPAWRAVVEANIINGATVDRIPIKKFPDFEVSIPSLSMQHSISEILSAYDDLIENNRRRIQLLEQAARLLYKEWFVHFRFPGHEHTQIIDGVPEGWVAGTIGDLGEIITGKTPSKRKSENFGSDLPFIKTPDMHGNAIVVHTEESLSEKGAKTQANKTLPPRSILVSCIGTVGAVAFNASPAQTNQQINSIVLASDSVTYWAYFMAKELKPLLEGMGGGATMANVNKSKFSGIKVIIPSKQLLGFFSDFAKPVFDQIENLTISNARLAKARDLLLPKLMNGEMAV